MKKYCLITSRISVLGGAELYVLRRAMHLKSKGIEVYIIVKDMKGSFALKDQFEEFPLLCLSNIKKPITLYSNKSRQLIYDKVSRFIGDISEGIVFESNMMMFSRWAELFAYYFGGKNIIYLVNDEKVYEQKFFLREKYFEYKLAKGEFIGLTKEFLSLIFGRKIEEEKNRFVNIGVSKLSPISGQSIKNIINDIKSNEDPFVIGTVGRLEKSYVRPLIEGVLAFSHRHPNQKILLLIIGGGIKEKVKEKLVNKYCNTIYKEKFPNLTIKFNGPIYPMGNDLFEQFDVFIGEGTASLNSISTGCATLVMSSYAETTDGILGVDTFSFGYLFHGKVYKVEDKISELYTNRDKLMLAKQAAFNLYHTDYEELTCFQKMDDYINSTLKDNQYFNLQFTFLDRIHDFARYYFYKAYKESSLKSLFEKIKQLT